MTSISRIAQADLRCTNCAGQCAYDPASRSLKCKSCFTEHKVSIDPNLDPAAEQHYDPDLPHTEQPEFSSDRPYRCETCGGEVVFYGHSISEKCPYCEGALVERPNDECYEILGMIPFSYAEKQAQDSAQEWVQRRWAAPSDLGEIVSRGRVAGMYVPFWTFDSKEAVKYTVIYKHRKRKRFEFRSKKGSMKTHFDDLLMPASPHVTPLIRDGIIHEFVPENLRPFEPAYLAGFAAERHHQSVKQGLDSNAADKALLLRNRIKKHSGKKNITHVSYKTDTTGIKYRRILLPVWLLHYEYEGERMKVVTCGIHGRTFGERPFSNLKLFGLAAIVSTAVIAFGFSWGALNLY